MAYLSNPKFIFLQITAYAANVFIEIIITIAANSSRPKGRVGLTKKIDQYKKDSITFNAKQHQRSHTNVVQNHTKNLCF